MVWLIKMIIITMKITIINNICFYLFLYLYFSPFYFNLNPESGKYYHRLFNYKSETWHYFIFLSYFLCKIFLLFSLIRKLNDLNRVCWIIKFWWVCYLDKFRNKSLKVKIQISSFIFINVLLNFISFLVNLPNFFIFKKSIKFI